MTRSGDTTRDACLPTRRQEVLRSRLRSRAMDEVRDVVRALADGTYTAPSGAVVPIATATADSVANTYCVDPTTNLATPGTELESVTVSVTEESTVEAALRLRKSQTAVAILNFASATNPGGSWHVGARYQEEDLIRASTLLDCLEQAGPSFFEAHKNAGPPLFADVCLYSPGVLLIRDSDGPFLERPVPVGVLTCAAPRADLAGESMADDLSAAVHRRIDLILRTAADAGNTDLVLGAWGCGVYGNDPHVVAAAFAELLVTTYRSTFSQVVFAIVDRSPRQDNLRAFREHLA